MQLEVFLNPIVRTRRAFPYVVVPQADIVAQGRERIIAFLAAKAQVGAVAGRLTPLSKWAAGSSSCSCRPSPMFQ